MKRVLVETALAALIFIAANAVFGVHTLIGHSLHSTRHPAAALSMSMGSSGEPGQSSCLSPDFDRQRGSVVLPNPSLAIALGSMWLPHAPKLPLVRKLGFTDTVTLVVDPE